MRTLNEYFPAMREAPGRIVLAPWTMGLSGLAFLVLAGAVAYAIQYPAAKLQGATARLAAIANLQSAARQATQAAITRMLGLQNDQQPKYVNDAIAKQAATLQAKLGAERERTPTDVLAQAKDQLTRYVKAQAYIAQSPFKGLADPKRPGEKDLIPNTPEGNRYRAALAIQPPPRFEYEQLEQGADEAMKSYNEAIALQVIAEKALHGVDTRLNGQKAEPLAPLAASQATGRKSVMDAPDFFMLSEVDQKALLEDEERQRAKVAAATAPASPPGDSAAGPMLAAPASAPSVSHEQQADAADPVAVAQKQAEQEQARADAEAKAKTVEAQRQAAAAKARADAEVRAKAAEAKAQADREQRERQATIDAQKRAEAQAAAQAKAAADAQASKERAAVEHNKQVCNKSLLNRIACQAQGVDPTTGLRKGDKAPEGTQ